MKKLILCFFLSMTIAASFTGCTEEEVRPVPQGNGGGSGSDPKG